MPIGGWYAVRMRYIACIATLLLVIVHGGGLSACSSTDGTRRVEQGRAGMPRESRERVTMEHEVLEVLDALHAAASKADGTAYFALYAPEAVFIGTDAGERWTKEEFRAYAEPYFSKGTGWTYVPREGARHVTVLPGAGGEVAFFEELLESEKYGTCRGTGVVRKIDGEWRVSQYHLTFPVPNDLAEKVTGEIKAWEVRGGGAGAG